jgi:hypothetical protein
VDGDAGTQATPDIVGSGEQFASVNEVLKPGVQGGSAGESGSKSALVALFEDGTYDSFDEPIEINRDGTVIKGLSTPTIQYTGGSTDNINGIDITGANVTIEDIQFELDEGRDGDGNNNPFTGGSAIVTLRNVDLTLRNVAISMDPSGDGFDSGSVRMFQFEEDSPGDVGNGNITIENCSFTNNGNGDGLFRTATFFRGGGFLNDAPAVSADRNVIIRDSVFRDGCGTQAHASVPDSSSHSITIKNNVFSGDGTINGYPEGPVTITGNNFNGTTNESDIVFASIPNEVNGTSVSTSEEGAQTAADTYANANNSARVIIQRDEFDDNGDRVTIAGPATAGPGT